MKIRIKALDKARVKWFVAILLSGTLIACSTKIPPEDLPLTPKQSEQARVLLVDWLECEECTENQLEKLLKYDVHLQPLLISALGKGAAESSKALYQYELEKRYDELLEYSRKHPASKPSISKRDFVELYMNNFNAQYRVRSAKALSAIGGEKSRNALMESLNKKHREDVKRAIEDALNNIR